MFGADRVVALIPARAGSKGVPRKNLRLLGGKPLVRWPIDTARATPEVDRIVVSTDGEAIAAAAREAGAEVSLRPAHLASDTALAADVIRHHIAELRAAGETARYMLLLEPTAPFRLPSDIAACLAMARRDGLDSVATFAESPSHPHRSWRIDEEGRPVSFLPDVVQWRPRQLLPPALVLNGCVYCFVIDAFPREGAAVLFGRSGAVTISRRRSIDIDDAMDFTIAEALLAENVLSHP